MFEFLGCQIEVPPVQMSAIVRTESQAHPYAIGVVGHKLSRQPTSQVEANNLVAQLVAGKYNYSVGIAQINQANFKAFGLHQGNMFDVCSNLRVGSQILKSCYEQYQDWSKAYSCYYSGNAVTGFQHGYVPKVLKHLSLPILTAPLQPSIDEADVPIQLLPHKKSSQQGGQKQEGQKAATEEIAKPKNLRQRRLSSSLSTY